MWREANWDFVTTTAPMQHGGVGALTAESPPRLLLELASERIGGTPLLRLPTSLDRSGYEVSGSAVSVSAPVSSGLTSERAEIKITGVKPAGATADANPAISAISLTELPKYLNEFQSRGGLLSPSVLAAIGIAVVRRPELLGSVDTSPVHVLDEPGVRRSVLGLVTPRPGETVVHKEKFIEIRKSAEGPTYAVRPGGVIGAVIMPTLCEGEGADPTRAFLIGALQRRVPIGAFVLSHPAGLVGDKGSRIEDCDVGAALVKIGQTVKNELWEEVGVRTNEHIRPACVCPSFPGFSTEAHIYVPVRGVIAGEGGGAKDENEKIDRVRIPFSREGIVDYIDNRLPPGSEVELSFYAGIALLLPELIRKG